MHTDNADVMASVLHLKAEYDRKSSRRLRLTFAGAAEAHLLAHKIGDAGVSVILTPSRPFPHTWDQRRMCVFILCRSHQPHIERFDRLPGPPLSYDSAVTTLLAKGVNVAIGVIDEYSARSTRFDLAWVNILHWILIPQMRRLHFLFVGCVGVQRKYRQSASNCSRYDCSRGGAGSTASLVA